MHKKYISVYKKLFSIKVIQKNLEVFFSKQKNPKENRALPAKIDQQPSGNGWVETKQHNNEVKLNNFTEKLNSLVVLIKSKRA